MGERVSRSSVIFRIECPKERGAMQKMIDRISYAALAAAVLIGSATLSQAAITGSEHDFSGSGWSGGQICLPCHTPHNADTSVAQAPLWNHDASTATYTLYSSPTLDATLKQPTGNSKLCLSCHDGTVAVDSFSGLTGNIYIDGGALIGTNLQDHHPVSFTYNAALAVKDGELADPTTAVTSLGGTIDTDLLFNAQVECASCHDVHDKAGNSDLLVISEPALCRTCHVF